MRHVAFDAVDEVGNEVVPAPQLNIDLRPRVPHPIAFGDQPVIDHDGVQHAGNRQQDDDPAVQGDGSEAMNSAATLGATPATDKAKPAAATAATVPPLRGYPGRAVVAIAAHRANRALR